jgi:hypothetical protein
LFDLFSSKFKEDASVSRAVDIQKLCIVFQNFTVVVILVISRLGKFSFALASVLVPLHDFFVCIEVVLLEFVYEEALVVGELGFIKEVRLPHSSDQIHNVSLSLKVLNTVVVEVQALNTLLDAYTFLAATGNPRQETSEFTVVVQVIVSLSSVKFCLQFRVNVRAFIFVRVGTRVFGTRFFIAFVNIFVSDMV